MFKGSVSRLRFRQLEDLFHTGIAGDLSDNELLDRFLHAGTQSEKPRSRRWSNGTARWSFVCAGRCSRITTPPRTPCRRRFWSWRGRLARFANEHPSRAGCSEWRAGRRHESGWKKRGGDGTSYVSLNGRPR